MTRNEAIDNNLIVDFDDREKLLAELLMGKILLLNIKNGGYSYPAKILHGTISYFHPKFDFSIIKYNSIKKVGNRIRIQNREYILVEIQFNVDDLNLIIDKIIYD